jgi:hypothetical protein
MVAPANLNAVPAEFALVTSGIIDVDPDSIQYGEALNMTSNSMIGCSRCLVYRRL